MTDTTVEVRDDHYLFAGSDEAHTAVGTTSITAATVAGTVLMLDEDGDLVAWDGLEAGTAVGVLALDLAGTETTATYYKSGTFATDALTWPATVSENIKANAFVGSALSHQ